MRAYGVWIVWYYLDIHSLPSDWFVHLCCNTCYHVLCEAFTDIVNALLKLRFNPSSLLFVFRCYEDSWRIDYDAAC